jgi:hypothetical protein
MMGARRFANGHRALKPEGLGCERRSEFPVRREIFGIRIQIAIKTAEIRSPNQSLQNNSRAPLIGNFRRYKRELLWPNRKLFLLNGKFKSQSIATFHIAFEGDFYQQSAAKLRPGVAHCDPRPAAVGVRYHVLAEILVPERIEQLKGSTLILEGRDRGTDRDAPLALGTQGISPKSHRFYDRRCIGHAIFDICSVNRILAAGLLTEVCPRRG